MWIENVTKLCTNTSLVIRISELSDFEKDYEAMQIKIETGEWIDIPITGIDSHYSNTVTIENLPTNTVQRVMGKVKKNGVWEDLIDTSFVVTEIYNFPPNTAGGGVKDA